MVKLIKEKLSKFDMKVMIPAFSILTLICFILIAFPEKSSSTIMYIRTTILNKMSIYYLLVGILFVSALFIIAFSKIGKIRLGNNSKDGKPKFSNLSWGCMIFTSTMAADILFYSLHEWSYYYNSLPLDFNEMSLGEKQTWASSYPLFHWGAIPWSFYLILAVSYGLMFYKNHRTRQTMSEACRPILKSKVDGIIGKIIDILAVVGLLAGTATTFSITTPLMTKIVCTLFNIESSYIITCLILIVIAAVYTIVVISGFKGISKLSIICTSLFCALVGIFLLGDGLNSVQYILESGLNGIGNMINNFIRMSSWTDPARLSSGTGVNIGNSVTGFPQDWTIFYWAYWIVWCVATPFFIAKISEGRTVKSVLLGGLGAGLLGTFTSFIVFGGFGMYNQVQGRIDIAGEIASGSDPSTVIMSIIDQIPFTPVVLVILFLAMISFYASTFDALTYVMSSYSYKNLGLDKSPSKRVTAVWCIALILLPIALTIYDFGIYEIQSISIIAALPLSIIIILILLSFIKEARKIISKNSKQDEY